MKNNNMYENWTNENLVRCLDMLNSFELKMKKEFFDKKANQIFKENEQYKKVISND